MNQTGQEQRFENTPEAQEYLTKLQTERIKLPQNASQLEHEALKNLKEAQHGIRQATTRQGDLDKQIANLETQRQQISKEIDMMSGEATGYARMLVSAEGSRRKEVEGAAAKKEVPKPAAAGGGNGKMQNAETADGDASKGKVQKLKAVKPAKAAKPEAQA